MENRQIKEIETVRLQIFKTWQRLSQVKSQVKKIGL